MIKFLHVLIKKFNLNKLVILGVFLSILLLTLYLPLIIDSLSKKEQKLSICTFADLFSHSLIEKFEKNTGIKVLVKYCELDSEFWTQLYKSDGNGFDLVTPTDFIVFRLIQNKLIQKIDRSLLKNFNGINEIFLKKDFDPNLEYSVPFAWNYYAIGYNKKFFLENDLSCPDKLEHIFEPDKNLITSNLNFKVALFEDNPQELLFLGGLYLFGNSNNLNSQESKAKLVDLYINHKRKWLYAFVFANMYYYLSSVVPAVLCFASLLKNLLKEFPDTFGAAFPKEGSVVVPQSFCITKGAQNIEAAHQFIDFFMREENLSEIFESSGYMPVKTKLLTKIRADNEELKDLVPTEDLMEKLTFINQTLSPEVTEELWLTVKSVS